MFYIHLVISNKGWTLLDTLSACLRMNLAWSEAGWSIVVAFLAASVTHSSEQSLPLEFVTPGGKKRLCQNETDHQLLHQISRWDAKPLIPKAT